MKKSVMTAGDIYEVVYKLREEISEYKEALDTIKDRIGEDSAAYKLVQKEKDTKFKELREFESRVFTLQQQQINDQFWADTPASRPR